MATMANLCPSGTVAIDGTYGNDEDHIMKDVAYRFFSNSKPLVAVSLLITGLSFGSAYGTIIPLTGDPVSLESLEGTLTVGDKVFSDITLSAISTGGAITPDEGSIFLQGVQDDVTGDLGLKFLLSWAAFSGQTVRTNIKFKAAIEFEIGMHRVDGPSYENFFIK